METSFSTLGDWYSSPNKVYTIEELGFESFVGIKAISSGECVYRVAGKPIPGHQHYTSFSIGGDAHTHKCVDDDYFNAVCVRRLAYLVNGDLTPSDLLWHEYAHVLDNSLVLNCTTVNDMFSSTEEMQEVMHGDIFKSICDVLGHPSASMRAVIINH